MSLLALNGWAQPADALQKALDLNAPVFDFSDYDSLESSFAGLTSFADAEQVIGWSTGGYLALHAIAAGVLRPKTLTLIAAPYQFVSDEHFHHGMDRTTDRLFRESYASEPVRTKQRFHALIARGDSKAKHIIGQLAHHPDVDNASRWLPWLDILSTTSLRDADLSMAPPTIIIHGISDAIVRFAQGEALAAKLPNARLERWEETGHAPHLHDKQRLKELL